MKKHIAWAMFIGFCLGVGNMLFLQSPVHAEPLVTPSPTPKPSLHKKSSKTNPEISEEDPYRFESVHRDFNLDVLPQFETVIPTPTPKPITDIAVTLAIAVPQPLTFGLQEHREGSDLDTFVEGGFFKYPITSASRSFSDYSFEAGVRYHPFQNWFYVTGELGFREVGLSVDISNLKQGGVALANTATLSVGTFFFGALVGGEWKVSHHLSLAFDLGVQIALIHTGNIEIHGDSSSNDDLSVDDQKELSRISGLPLPQIALLRVLWYL